MGVFTKKGAAIYIDLAVDGKIACIEALDQPEIRRYPKLRSISEGEISVTSVI